MMTSGNPWQAPQPTSGRWAPRGRVNTTSLAPLYLQLGLRSLVSDEVRVLSSATGFLIDLQPVAIPGEPRALLVTAWHVLAGRDAQTGDLLDWEPDVVRVHFVPDSGIMNPVVKNYDLKKIESEIPQNTWLEHPLGSAVDIAILPLQEVPFGVLPLSFEYRTESWPTVRTLRGADATSFGDDNETLPLPLRIADRLFILGYPFGDQGTWPTAIWTTAPIASEPARGLSVQGRELPGFLVDSRSRSGQSGAPVLMHIRPGDPVWAGYDTYHHLQQVTALVGVYSGRITKQSDLGKVWTLEAIQQVVDAM